MGWGHLNYIMHSFWYFPQKDLYTENFKTLMKELKMIQRNGNLFHALGLEELILFKWPYYAKQSTDLMWSLSNYAWHFFTELEQIIL